MRKKPVQMLSSRSHDRPLSRARARPGLQRCLFLYAIFIAAVAVSAASDSSTKAEILAFDLLPVTNSSESGVFEVSLGPRDGTSNQRIGLLASPYTNSDAMIEVPIATLCEADPIGDWNVITSPHTGDVIVTGTGVNETQDILSGGVVVRWNPSTLTSATKEALNLMLRKGRGEGAKNVSEIDSEFPSDRNLACIS